MTSRLPEHDFGDENSVRIHVGGQTLKVAVTDDDLTPTAKRLVVVLEDADGKRLLTDQFYGRPSGNGKVVSKFVIVDKE